MRLKPDSLASLLGGLLQLQSGESPIVLEDSEKGESHFE